MSTMIRKNISLPKALEQRIRVLSHQRQRSEAHVIRDILEDGMAQQQSMSTGTALLGLARLGKTLDIRLGADASSRIDDDLYGTT